MGERRVPARSLYPGLSKLGTCGFGFCAGGPSGDVAWVLRLPQSDPLRYMLCDWLCDSAGKMQAGEMDNMGRNRTEDDLHSGSSDYICTLRMGWICCSGGCSGVCGNQA